MDILAVAIVSLLAAISPGPDFFVVLRNSLSYSRKAGFYTSLGVAIALIAHLTYTIVGIGVLIAESEFLFHAIKYTGAAYLFYIGFTGVKASFQKDALNLDYKKDKVAISDFTAFKQGFLTNLLNPKAAVFFISLFSQFIGSDTPTTTKLTYAFVNWSMTFGWFIFLSFLVTTQRFLSKIDRFRLYIDRIMGSALMLLSIKLIWV